jgi:hypothetical protein
VIWIPIAAWLAALMVAAVVLGFCAHEILWKSKRLRADLRELQGAAERIAELRVELAAAQQRLTATGLR